MKLRTLVSWLLLSITLMVCAHAQNKEVDQYLAQKAPLKTVSYEKLSETTRDLIKKTIDKDPESAKKVISHYVDLLKGTPDFEDSLSGSRVELMIAQQGLMSDLVIPLKDELNITNGMIALLYHLKQREDAALLNFYHNIAALSPENLLDQQGKGSDEEAYEALCRKLATHYAQIKDPEYAEFFKTAWFTLFQRNMDAQYARPKAPNKVLAFKSGVAKEDEFYDWIHYSHAFNYYFACRGMELYNKFSGYDNIALFLYRQENLLQPYEDYLKHVRSFDPHNRLIMLSAIYDSPIIYRPYNNYIPYAEMNSEIDDLLVDSYIELVNKDSQFRYSNDSRYFLIYRATLDFIDEGRSEQYGLECAKSFAAALDFRKNGGAVHNNLLNNLAVQASRSRKSAALLHKSLKERAAEVKGMPGLAQALLRHGYIDTVYQILPPGEIKHVEKHYYRLSHQPSIDENLPKLLAMYKDTEDKLMARRLMLLHDDEASYLEQTTTFRERLGGILELAESYDSELQFGPSIEPFMKVFEGSFRLSDQGLLEDYYTLENEPKSADYYFNKAEEGELYFHDARELLARVSLAIYYEDKEFLQDLINAAHKIYGLDHVDGADQAYFMDQVINSIASGIHQLYGEGEEDELLIDLLPIYREALKIRALTASYIKVSERSNRVIAPRAHRLVEVIHHDLGKIDDYKAWVEKLGPKGKYLVGRMQMPFTFSIPNHGKYSTVSKNGYKGMLLDNLKLMKRVINDDKFQEHIVSGQIKGGVIDYMVDRRDLELKQALDFIEGGHIKVKNPAFEGMLYSDKAHFAALQANYKLMDENFKKMHAVFEKHPTPNPARMASQYVRAVAYYNAIGEVEKAKGFLPKSLLAHLDKGDLEAYNAVMKKIAPNQVIKARKKRKKPRKR